MKQAQLSQVKTTFLAAGIVAMFIAHHDEHPPHRKPSRPLISLAKATAEISLGRYLSLKLEYIQR